ncbi:MAG: UDP-N-acetylglucosamine 2-epimerase (non-hydrolyzing) [Candidatus Woesearchaeota archaeon]|jgi:UDP-N-acetylglucosamine 2-epimerase (non-hydrolysing)
MKLCIILGTRPEIIKLSPIIKECIKRNIQFIILHTGQHYSYTMDKVFFENFELPLPNYNLNTHIILEEQETKSDLLENPDACTNHGKQLGIMLGKIEEILIKERPDLVIVQGDTNTTLAGALAAAKLHIKIAHVESGLRSYDNKMPEEINRILTDRISDFLFVPTQIQEKILLQEGVSPDKIFVVGNTITDVVYTYLPICPLPEIQKEYFLMTLHRQENVDNKEILCSIFCALKQIYAKYHIPILFPIHPRTQKRLEQFGIVFPEGIQLHPPTDFFTFLSLEKNAKMILTDSGGIQEESCILGVPCVTLRDNTERPETILVQMNILAGTTPEKIIQSCNNMYTSFYSNNKNKVISQKIFGDGTTAQQILNILKNKGI